MMKHSFILIISELETRKNLLKLTYLYIYIKTKVIPSQHKKIKTLKTSSKPKIYPIKKKKKKIKTDILVGSVGSHTIL